jgi:ribosomal protein L11 methyltransferase
MKLLWLGVDQGTRHSLSKNLKSSKDPLFEVSTDIKTPEQTPEWRSYLKSLDGEHSVLICSEKHYPRVKSLPYVLILTSKKNPGAPVAENEQRHHFFFQGKSAENFFSLLRALSSLAEKNEKLKTQETLTDIDPLTELPNRRRLLSKVKLELERAQRYSHRLSLAFLDVDHFKEYNDRFGHQIGDQVLSEVSKTLKQNLRTSDWICRYGGDEFVLVLPYTGAEEALNTLNRIRREIKQLHLPFTYALPGGRLTVSAGLATYPKHLRANDEHQLIEFADRALLEAKRRGRNQVQVSKPAAESEESIRVQIQAPLKSSDRVTELAFQKGCLGIEEWNAHVDLDPSPGNLKNPEETAQEFLGEKEIMTLYFDPKAMEETKEFIEELRSISDKEGLDLEIQSFEVYENENWEEKIYEGFSSFSVGDKLRVLPPWEDDYPKGQIPIAINPAMAFGTGTHETTKGCLELLEKISSRMSAMQKKEGFLDFGCGSGILGIAALKLGFRNGVFIDIEEEALRETQENLDLNDLSSVKALITEKPDDFREKYFSLVMANVLAKPLIENLELFKGHQKKSAYLILSGLLLGQKDHILKSYTPFYELIDERAMGDWLSLLFQRKGKV